MCGICGIYEVGTTPDFNRARVIAMADSLEHRGPDGEGFYCSEHISLGHRRLSIIDLEGGDQPIFNEDNSICIVFNGEIYNYRELRKELISLGHIFKTMSDTEVIVHLYEERGIDCVKALNGMFAFAIWDNHKQRLFLSRDRMGEKPLYYLFKNGKLTFASELKAILTNPDVERQLDLEVMNSYLTYGYVPEPKSILKGHSKLPAAHSLIAENGKISVHRYWSIEFPIEAETDPRAEQEVTEELEALLNDSVKIRLRSDVPVGAFLSGGIDSSLMVALAAEQSSQQLTTFSVGFTEEDYDELQYAKQVAERYNTNHHEIFLQDLDFSLFPKIVNHFDEPFADPSSIPTYYVTREASKHLKVCLSGDGGDELFCGYSRYNFEPLEQLLDKIPAALRRLIFDNLANQLPDSFPGKGRLRRIAASRHQRWQRMVGPFDFFERRRLFKEEYRHIVNDDVSLFRPYFEEPKLGEVSCRMLADQRTYLPDDILVKVDRNSMWHGLEVRVPFLDHRVVEFANQLPLSVKKYKRSQKYIIKKILHGKVPEEILTRKKKGFGLPLKYWLKGSLQDFSREMLDSTDSRLHQYLDKQVIRQLIYQHNNGRRDLSKRIWTLLWLEQWCRLAE